MRLMQQGNRQWAFALLERERNGFRLTPTQREMAKDAANAAPEEPDDFGGETQPIVHRMIGDGEFRA